MLLRKCGKRKARFQFSEGITSAAEKCGTGEEGKKKKEKKRKRILGFGLVEVPFLFPLMSFVVILWKITIKFCLPCLLVLMYQVENYNCLFVPLSILINGYRGIISKFTFFYSYSSIK